MLSAPLVVETPGKETAPPRVSVVVVNQDRVELLKECLSSLLQQTLQPLEIIVADNGSQDGSREFVGGLTESGVSLLAFEDNQGFAAANNRAVEAARGSYIALLNNDAIADPKWLESLLGPLLEDSKCGMCASKILLNPKTIDKAGHLIYLDGQNRGRGTGQIDRGQFDQPSEVLLPDGCAALYRRELWDQTGGMDEDFFAYADDADLGLRARWLGWTCRYVPQAVVWHRQSSTTAPYAEQKIFWIERNRVWLAVKNLPWYLLLMNPVLTLYRWSWNLLAALLGQGAADKFRRREGWARAARTVLRANLCAWLKVGRVWGKRREIRRQKSLSDWEFLRLIWKYRISARELAFDDPERHETGIADP